MTKDHTEGNKNRKKSKMFDVREEKQTTKACHKKNVVPPFIPCALPLSNKKCCIVLHKEDDFSLFYV